MANKNLGIEDGSIESTSTIEPASSGLFWFVQKDGSRCYYVLATDINETDEDIKATTGLPALGDLIDGAPVRSLSAKEIQRVRHPSTGVPTILWKVEVKTDTRFDATNQTATDPTDVRPKRRWYTEKENERVEVDVNLFWITTSAEEPLNVEWPRANIYLEIERYEAYPTDPSAIFAYVEHCNDDTFYGAPVGTVLLDDIQSDEEVINGVTYIRVRYVFKFVMRTEDDGVTFLENTVRIGYFLNQGYMYRKTAGAVAETYLDKHGHPQKINLALDGTKLGETDDPVRLDYDMTPYADFSALNLEF